MAHFSIFLISLLLLLPISVIASDETKTENPVMLKISVENYQEEIGSNTLEQWINNSPRLELDENYKSEIENIQTCKKIDSPCDLISSLNNSLHIRKVDRVSVNHQNISVFINDLSQRVNKDPIDSKFKVENNRVVEFASSQSGIKLNIDGSILALEKATQKIASEQSSSASLIDLSWEKIAPAIQDSDGNRLGITTLIGEGVSNFAGSPKNRIFNIRVATARFNGILIKPEEEFSFVSVLGEVDGEHGYLPELVIKKDKTEPEFGGGICQVSTTAFRAAIYSGLKITARRNHAYPVSYYNPQGMDATVYVPRPDLRFKNNTPGHILIQTKIEGTTLKFLFYGTDDGRKIAIDGPTITQRNPDGSMKATFTQNATDKDGNIFINDIFNSSYDSPSKYPHPGQETKLTSKPKDWSDREWREYKKANGI